MTVQFRPEPRRPFKAISDALSQGIQQGFQRRQSSDILDQVIGSAMNQEGDLLTNLLSGLQGSGASVGEGLEAVQRFAPLIESQRKSAESSQANDLVNSLISENSNLDSQPAQNTVSLSTAGENLNSDQVDTVFNEQSFQGQTPAQPKPTIQKLPDSKLIALQGHPSNSVKNIADAEVERRKRERKAFESDREFASKLAQPFLKNIDESRDSVRLKEFATESMLDAIETGDMGFFTKDNLANLTGIEAFRTAKGTQLITSLKEFLLGNIQRAGSRPNQWIEQQIAQMAPKIGRSKQANLAVAKMLQAEGSIEKKKIELSDDISNQMREQLGFVPENIGQLVNEQLKHFALEARKNLAYDLRKIHEDEQKISIKDINKKVPRGTPLTIRSANLLREKFNGDNKKAIEQAKRLGYEIPTAEEFRRWEQ